MRLWLVVGLLIGATGNLALAGSPSEAGRYLVAFDTSKKIEEHVISRQSALGITSAGQTSAVQFSLPSNTQISAVSASNGFLYAVSETSFEAGQQLFTPRTVFRQKENDSLEVVFDGTMQGIPENVKITGLSVNDSNIYFSLSIFAVVNGHLVSPNDIVHWNGETFSPYFSSAAAGIPATARVGDFHIFNDGTIEFTFDSSVQIAGTNYRRDSILQFDPTSMAWSASEFSDTFSALCVSCKLVGITYDAGFDSLFGDRFETYQ